MFYWLKEQKYGRHRSHGVGKFYKRARSALVEAPWGIMRFNPRGYAN